MPAYPDASLDLHRVCAEQIEADGADASAEWTPWSCSGFGRGVVERLQHSLGS